MLGLLAAYVVLHSGSGCKRFGGQSAPPLTRFLRITLLFNVIPPSFACIEACCIPTEFVRTGFRLTEGRLVLASDSAGGHLL